MCVRARGAPATMVAEDEETADAATLGTPGGSTLASASVLEAFLRTPPAVRPNRDSLDIQKRKDD